MGVYFCRVYRQSGLRVFCLPSPKSYQVVLQPAAHHRQPLGADLYADRGRGTAVDPQLSGMDRGGRVHPDFGVQRDRGRKSGMGVGHGRKIDQKVKTQTFFIRSLTADAESLISRAANEEVKTACKKVYEAVRYSDPMSSDALAAIESQITLKFAALSEAASAGDAEKTKVLADEMIILVGDRNNKCKLLK